MASSKHYPLILCNQKSIPMKVEKSFNAQLLTVSFTANQKIEYFSLKNVRGIDGATVLKFQELHNQKLESGESVQSNVELEKFSGLVYVVFDVSITVNGISSDHSIPVSLGALSKEQIAERSKNIKEIKNSKDLSNSKLPSTKKVHEMKLE